MAKPKPSSASSARQAKLRAQKDAASKARTLKKYGLATFRGSLSADSMTPRKMARVEKLFNGLMKETPLYVRGNAERIFYRPDPHKDYVLNERYFHFLKSDNPAPTQENILKTSKGNIVASPDKNVHIVGVRKDGTIVMEQGGQEVLTGRMTQKQTMTFLRSVDKGTFEWPKGYNIGVIYFQNSGGERLYRSLYELQRDLRYYKPKVDDVFRQQYPNFEPIKISYYKLSERETREQSQRFAKAARDKRYSNKKKGKKRKVKKGRRSRS